MSRADLWERIQNVLNLETEEARKKYAIGKDSKSWSLESALSDLRMNANLDALIEFDYRPFDKRWTPYTGNQGGIHFFPASKVSRHLVGHSNLAICYTRKIEGGRDFADIFLTTAPITLHSVSIKEVNSFAPLYIYPDEMAEQGDVFALTKQTLNLDPKLYAAISKAAGIDPGDTAMSRDAGSPHPNPSPEGEGLFDFRAATGDGRPSEVKVFDYIYGVLHSPAYRETFAEFLKIDFPRIPYPPSPEVFAHVSEKGEHLRRLHLMEPAAIGETPYPYHGDGDDVVASGVPKFEDGKGHIIKDQDFADVHEIAWTFHIGGYQPAQKWLKDRRRRALSWDDIGHYQKIVKILSETDRTMKEIELPLE